MPIFFNCKPFACFLILRITLRLSPEKVQPPQQSCSAHLQWGSLDPPRSFEDCSCTRCSKQQLRVIPHSACFSFLIQLASQLGDQEFVCWSLYCHIRELCTETAFKVEKLVYASETLNLWSVLIVEKSRKTEWIPSPPWNMCEITLFFLRNILERIAKFLGLAEKQVCNSTFGDAS